MIEEARFHPAVEAWFASNFKEPTASQRAAWLLIKDDCNVLVAAPTGSGKTLAAFLAAIDDLVRQGVASPLPDETQVVYVSPLKALSNDIERNLAAPIAGIRAELARLGRGDVELRTLVPPAHYPRDPPGVAVRAPRVGIGPQDARDDPHRDRRRDSRARRQQARQPPCVIARAAPGAPPPNPRAPPLFCSGRSH